ncbi:hypothetical protein KR026_008696 [Drosophila bipectinata]|nr:hypothetical protein KR026_008696 [Drosophila bipectinata]
MCRPRYKRLKICHVGTGLSSSSSSDSEDDEVAASRRFNAFMMNRYNSPDRELNGNLQGIPPWLLPDPVPPVNDPVASSESDAEDEDEDEGFKSNSDPEWSETEMDGPQMLAPEVDEAVEVGDFMEMDDAAEMEHPEPMESLD